MKNPRKTEYLPWLMLGLGGISWVVRVCLDRFGTDEKGLLIPFHPFELLLLALTAAAAVMIFLGAKQLPEEPATAHRAIPGLASLAFAVGVLSAVLAMEAYAPVEILTRALGFAAALGLMVCAVWYLRGKDPCFLIPVVVSVFFALYTVTTYRQWSGKTQLLSVLFAAGGWMLLALTAYYHAARQVGLEKEKLRFGAAMAAAFVCLTAAGQGESALLYATGGIWAALSLYTPEVSGEPEEA